MRYVNIPVWMFVGVNAEEDSDEQCWRIGEWMEWYVAKPWRWFTTAVEQDKKTSIFVQSSRQQCVNTDDVNELTGIQMKHGEKELEEELTFFTTLATEFEQ